jgi:hypothetical protein
MHQQQQQQQQQVQQQQQQQQRQQQQRQQQQQASGFQLLNEGSLTAHPPPGVPPAVVLQKRACFSTFPMFVPSLSG